MSASFSEGKVLPNERSWMRSTLTGGKALEASLFRKPRQIPHLYLVGVDLRRLELEPQEPQGGFQEFPV